MLMHDDKKKTASLIVAGLKGPQPEKAEDNVENDGSIAEETAAEDLMAAIEQKSPKAIVEAFKNLMECCSPAEMESEESEMME